jgi:ABC-type antimicrobial peptide transport system ATPase subunit
LKQGPEIQRKNNFIINTGDNLTAEEREQKIKQNKKKYGLRPEVIRSLKLPQARKTQKSEVVLTVEQIFHPKSNFSKIEKLHHLSNLRAAIR